MSELNISTSVEEYLKNPVQYIQVKAKSGRWVAHSGDSPHGQIFYFGGGDNYALSRVKTTEDLDDLQSCLDWLRKEMEKYGVT